MEEFKDIKSVIPHRAPILMLDRILEITDDGCKAYKNISYSEPVLSGHFPDYPIFPGALTIESMGQAAAYWMGVKYPGKMPIFVGIKDAHFKRPVLPGDQLVHTVKVVEEKNGFFTFACESHVGEKLAADATLIIVLK